MKQFDRANVILCIGFAAAAVVIALVWVPMDSETGLFEKVRRQVTIGDALAPSVAAGFLFLAGLMIVVFEPAERARSLTAGNLRYLSKLLLIVFVSFALMRWFGPVLVAVFTDGSYRLLRDAVPWKYAGFVTGGAFLVTGLIGLVEGRITMRGVVIGLGSAIVFIIIYDLPFDDLLLPPNGDV